MWLLHNYWTFTRVFSTCESFVLFSDVIFFLHMINLFYMIFCLMNFYTYDLSFFLHVIHSFYFHINIFTFIFSHLLFMWFLHINPIVLLVLWFCLHMNHLFSFRFDFHMFTCDIFYTILFSRDLFILRVFIYFIWFFVRLVFHVVFTHDLFILFSCNFYKFFFVCDYYTFPDFFYMINLFSCNF